MEKVISSWATNCSSKTLWQGLWRQLAIAQLLLCPDHRFSSLKLPSKGPEMAYDHMSEEEIDFRLKQITPDDELDIFRGWSATRKRKYFEDLMVPLPRPSEVLDLDSHKRKALNLKKDAVVDVTDSCIFDVTYLEDIHEAYIEAITHFQAWQLAGTDKIYTFGTEKSVFVTRSRGTFVFWIRHKTDDLGMVIDGQTGWAAGFLTRVVNSNGSYTYGTALQFKRPEIENKKKSSEDNVYIMSKQLVVLPVEGNYSKSVCDMDLDPSCLQQAVALLRRLNAKSRFTWAHQKACDVLILFIPEAAKNRAILQHTFDAMTSVNYARRIPACLGPTVVKFDKTCQSANSCLDGHGYTIVKGSPIRNLCQCINIHPFIKRKRSFATRFFLLDSQDKYLKGRNKAKVSPRKRWETVDDWSERQRERELRNGTLFDDDRHSGPSNFKGPAASFPSSPSEGKEWYNH
ncbi:hypothetical protein ACP70R_015782 [Stipagrostis hirtigluma subsp. patula]